MLTLGIMAVLIYSFYTGYRRGFIMQVVRLIGYGISLMFASRMYLPLSKVAEVFVPFPSIQQNTQLAIYNEAASFMLDRAFYRVISFVGIALVGWLLTNFVSLFFKKIAFYDFYKLANHIAGGVVNALISYVIIFFALFTLSLIPVEPIQQQFVNNPIAYRIVSQTPILTDAVTKAWLEVTPQNTR